MRAGPKKTRENMTQSIMAAWLLCGSAILLPAQSAAPVCPLGYQPGFGGTLTREQRAERRADGVTITTGQDGARRIRTPNYEATVGDDGCLSSFKIGGAELLFSGVARGTYFYQEELVGYSSVNTAAGNVITARGDRAGVRYTFGAGAVAFDLENLTDAELIFFAVLDSAASTIRDEQGAWQRLPVNMPATNGIYFKGKARLEVSGTDKLWGPWEEDHQVLQVTLAPRQQRRLVFKAGTASAAEAGQLPAQGPPPNGREAGARPSTARTRPVPARDALHATFEPAQPDGVFPAGQDLKVTLQLANRSAWPVDGTLECEWTTDLCEQPRVLAQAPAELFTLPAGQALTRHFTYRPGGPGFYAVTAVVKFGADHPVRIKLVPGYDVGNIQGPPARPADFDAFWEARLKELAGVKPEFSVEPVPERSTAKVDTCRVRMRSHGGVRVNGWLTIPKGKGPWPGLVSVAGYGGAETIHPATWRDQTVTLALSIRGQGDSQEDIDPKGQEYMFLNLTTNPADYIYVGAYLDIVRAVDLLCSRPEVDARRIGIEGGSQGGGLSLAGAALDPRIVACAAAVPWLCDWPDYAVTAPWAPENYPKLLAERKDLSLAKLHTILSYVDVLNLAPRIHCPVTVSMGLVDDTCPPRTIMAVYNRITAPKSIRYYPHGGHGGGGGADKAIRDRWLAGMLQAGNP